MFLLLNYCRFVPSSPQQSKDIIFFSDLGTKIQVRLYLTKHEVPIPIKTGTHHEKPEKFNGDDFKRWQQKMLFYLTTLNLVHVSQQMRHSMLQRLRSIRTSYAETTFSMAWLTPFTMSTLHSP